MYLCGVRGHADHRRRSPGHPIQTIRLGRLSAHAHFLDEIPSGIMARALRSHSRAVSETLETRPWL